MTNRCTKIVRAHNKFKLLVFAQNTFRNYYQTSNEKKQRVGGGVYGGRELPLKILQNFYCPHSIMVVAALGHSDIHFDFCFDLMFTLFFISPWIALGFQFNFEMIFTLIMQLLLLLNLLATSFYFQSFFFLCFAVTFHFTSSFDLFFFYFLLNLWKIVKFWKAALGHHRGVRVLQNHFNWVDVVKSLRWQICITNLLSWNNRRIARPPPTPW